MVAEVVRVKEFHLGDVLSITTGRLVSPRHIEGVYNILNFMTGDNLFTHQLPRASDECKPYLLKQFPQLAMPEMDLAVAELDEMLEIASGKSEKERVVTNWLTEQVAKYGETFVVKPIPSVAHKVNDPVDEAVEMLGPDKVRVVVLEE